MNTAATVRVAVEDYLAYRRRLGFALRIEGEELGRFGRYAEKIGHSGPITTDLAVQWATLPAEADRLYHARRLDMVRRLARHRAMFDAATEIPPEGMLGPSYRRREPHIYTDAEIAALLALAGQLAPRGGLRPLTYQALFGLLACAGLRISEALRLMRQDVDLDAGVVHVTAAKVRKSRVVPLDPTATMRLREYAARRDQLLKHRRSEAFFLSQYGTSVKYGKVIRTFVDLRRRLGWAIGRGGRLPRIHDIRHSFAVGRLLRWYEQGAQEVDRKIAALSTYLGHVKVSDTYWYLTAVPELLAASASRLERWANVVEPGGQT